MREIKFEILEDKVVFGGKETCEINEDQFCYEGVIIELECDVEKEMSRMFGIRFVDETVR